MSAWPLSSLRVLFCSHVLQTVIMTVRLITVWLLIAAGRSGVRIAAGPFGLSRLQIIQTCPGVHRACCSVGAAVKRPGHEAGRSSLSVAEVKGEWSCTSAHSIRLHGVERYSFAFTLPLP